jgi:hypothetical protein
MQSWPNCGTTVASAWMDGRKLSKASQCPAKILTRHLLNTCLESYLFWCEELLFIKETDIGNRVSPINWLIGSLKCHWLVIHWFTEPNFIICFAFQYRAHNFSNFIQKVTKCDREQQTLVRLHYQTTRMANKYSNKQFNNVWVYSSHMGDFQYFLNQLDDKWSNLISHIREFIICEDFNVDCLTESDQNVQLHMLFKTHSLTFTVNFSTIIIQAQQLIIFL